MRSALDMVSACASVLATMNSTPCSPDAIMLLTALPPAPPTPNTIMRAFISRISVMLVIFASRLLRQAGMRGYRLPPRGLGSRAISASNATILAARATLACPTGWPWRMPYFREIHAHQCFAIIRK